MKEENKKAKKIINIVFITVMVLMVLVATDIILVAKKEVGPFLAIPVKTYKDGGTKEYYGLGYKVIKYHQTQGRRDMVIGFWSLKYDTNPIEVDDVDLSIELNENKEATYKKYINQFVRIESALVKNDVENNEIILAYYDEGEKYSIELICSIEKEKDKILILEEGSETTVLGTIYKYEESKESNIKRFYLKHCFVEQ